MEKYNTFWGRLMAGAIDSFVLLPIGLLDSYFFNPRANLGAVLVWLLISYSSFFIYSIYFHWKTGQTIGKKAMSVKVIDLSEEKGLSLKQAFLRDSVYIVLQVIGMILVMINIIRIGRYSETGLEPYSTFFAYLSLMWFAVEVITMLTNRKRRALHDMIAKTVVVNV